MILILVLCLSLIAPITGYAVDDFICPTEDGSAFGLIADASAYGDELYSDSLYATSYWIDCAVPEAEMRALLNAQTLYPQRTGWLELDQLIENLLSQAGENADTYDKLRYAYDYLVKNVTYSWEGYSNTNASVASYNSVTGYNYLAKMTYEDSLQKSILDDMSNRAYHILKYKKGVCYDYAIAIAVIARYLGIDSFVHTGLFYFEPYYGMNYAGHHGWALLVINGQQYVFDPQRDARNWEYNNRKNGYYFGIDYDTATNKSNRPCYVPNHYADDKAANAARDASLLPVASSRTQKVSVSVSATAGGTASGAGNYITGTSATLNATPSKNHVFVGWYSSEDVCLSENTTYVFTVTCATTITAKFCPTYELNLIASRSGTATGSGIYAENAEAPLKAESQTNSFQGWYLHNGTLVSEEATYSFSVKENTTLYAMFEGDVFYDLQEGDWYAATAVAAANRGIINGMTNIEFGGDVSFNRAMLVKILANIEQADTSASAPSPFVDVTPDTWYYNDINWAYEKGITNGVDETHFNPEEPITREQIITMVVRYLEYKEIELTSTELTYPDADLIAEYAQSSVQKAQSIGLIEGYTDGSLQPQNELPRREGVTIMMRLVDYLDNLADMDE